MIKELFVTLLPSLLLLSFILLTAFIFKKVEIIRGLKSIVWGMVAVIPALLTIYIINTLIDLTISFEFPLFILISISALNEEAYKYIFIKQSYTKKYSIIYGLLIAGGFSLGETIYLAFGNLELSYYRSLLTLPLHMVTSIFLSLYYKKRELPFLTVALIIHITFNILLIR